jgi:hypothetical protein
MEQGEEEREEGKRVAVCVLGGRFGRVPASPIPPFGARAAVLIHEFSNVHTSHLMQHYYQLLHTRPLIVEYLLNNGVAVAETGQLQA